MPRAPTSSKSLTIHDVAREAKVSKSTVSLVLQGSTLIRDETAARVREAASKLGYVYNRRAAELRQQSSKTVGVIINDLMNPFFAELLVGIERKLVDAGYIVLMAHTQEDRARQKNVLTSMREQHAAGILMCPAIGTTSAAIREVQGWGIPLVVMVRSLGRGTYDFTGADNELGMLLAMEHLLKAGHRRIAFVGGQAGTVYGERLSGYRKAIELAGLRFDERLVSPAEPNRSGGRAAMAKILGMKLRPSAAVCYNDVSAFGAMTALGDVGMRAGNDFALIGFDNLIDAENANPPLSTVDIRPGELGERAASALMTRIASPEVERQVYICEPHLVLRQSG